MNKKGIPIPKIQIKLDKDEPTKITAEELHEELNAIGLNCVLADVNHCEKYIESTIAKFPEGKVQGYQIYSYDSPNIEEFLKCGCTKKNIAEIAVTDNDLHANWQPKDSCPYMAQLAAVGFPEHFDFLKKNYLTFAGVQSSKTTTDETNTVDAIKTQFVEIASNISATLVEGLDKDMMEATLSRVIEPVAPDAKDYDSGLVNRNIFLVNGYDPEASECEAIGVLNVEYQLVIKNYKEKKSEHQEYTLSIEIRTSLYTDVTELMNEVMYLQSNFKGKMFFVGSIPYPTEVEIFDVLPPANNDTFIKSLPLVQTEDDKISVMVLYTPDLEDVGCIDNTNSSGAATYSKSITSGFSIESTQLFNYTTNFSAGVGVVKGGISTSFEISFTEQYNRSQTETVTFSVPSGERAFLYQGYMKSMILEYNIRTFSYEYKEPGRFTTNMITTATDPIVQCPAYMQSIKKVEKEKPLWQTINLI